MGSTRGFVGIGMSVMIMNLIYTVLLALIIYCLVLFIKLARRGIKALDIYIDKNIGVGR